MCLVLEAPLKTRCLFAFLVPDNLVMLYQDLVKTAKDQCRSSGDALALMKDWRMTIFFDDVDLPCLTLFE